MTLPIQIISATIRAVPRVVSLLKPETLEALKAAAGYDGIRDRLWNAVSDAVQGFLNSNAHVGTYARPMATAVSAAYLETLDLAYQDGGGELPIEEDTAAWAKGVLDAQLSYVDSLFQSLRDLRKEGGTDINIPDEAVGAADRWTSALDGFYAEAKMRGSKNIMLTWHLGATEKHCKTCASLDGKSHKIQWYLDRDYIPRKPYAGMDCKGFNCDCSLVDKFGNEYTV